MRTMLLAGLLLGLATGARADEKDKGTKVELGGMTATTPASWVKQATNPKSSIKRAYQFALPKAEGDKQNAELVIFEGLGGSAQSNVDRWKGQYTPPKGKTTDDVAKESKIKIGGSEGDMLDISGTYNAPQFDPTFKGKNENFRLLGIQIKLGDTNYHIKLAGPAKTVEKHKKDFDAWLKGFKK